MLVPVFCYQNLLDRGSMVAPFWLHWPSAAILDIPEKLYAPCCSDDVSAPPPSSYPLGVVRPLNLLV